MFETIKICTNETRVGFVRSVVGPYLVEEKGPTEYDSDYILTITVPCMEWLNLRKAIMG